MAEFPLLVRFIMGTCQGFVLMDKESGSFVSVKINPNRFMGFQRVP